MVRDYGSGLRADTLHPWIEKLKLPKGVDLSHLTANKRVDDTLQ